MIEATKRLAVDLAAINGSGASRQPSLLAQATRVQIRRRSMDYYRIEHRFLQRKASATWNPAFSAKVAIFKISEEFKSVLGVTSSAENIMLDKQGEHIRFRHRVDSRRIIASIPHALSNIRYLGGIRRLVKYPLVGRTSYGKQLFVVPKFIPASQSRCGIDEAWIDTAHFVSDSKVTQMLRNRKIRPIFRS